MFHSSTQKKHWLFRDSEELDRLRKTTSQNYFEKVGVAGADICDPCTAHYHMSPSTALEGCCGEGL